MQKEKIKLINTSYNLHKMSFVFIKIILIQSDVSTSSGISTSSDNSSTSTESSSSKNEIKNTDEHFFSFDSEEELK